ncbi:TM1802 family CRISPR-associated protein [Chitinophaga sp. 30R24]|uniref:TM1802 family CRISPR-associated protein n=1 Tax=Chitinophaga sp. 30R24 TaxID=3248838 RepID=UPI003B909E58
MLLTLTRLGEQLSRNLDEWSDIIDIPKINAQKENLITGIIFNLDEQTISLHEVSNYSEDSPYAYRNVAIKGGNNKATYVCCDTGKIIQIEKTFFGKIDNKGNLPAKGEFQEYIDNKFPELRSTLLYQVLAATFSLRERFLEEQWNKPETIYDNAFDGNYKSNGSKSSIVLTYAAVLSPKLGIQEITRVSALEGYEKFIRLDRLTQPVSKEQKISYASGSSKENVTSVAFPNRYSINYMFVETTLNYAAGFNKNNFHKNYQVNSEEQLYLERASEYLLKTQQISIAGISHCIIPQFLSKKTVNYHTILEETYKKSELLFQGKVFAGSITSIEDEMQEGDIYWLNFLAFESDGNSFKTINLIKDVSKTHFEKVLKVFEDTDLLFKTLEDAVAWQDVMTEYWNQEKKSGPFNLYNIYQLIPLRKDKEKKNNALSIFKSILETRKINTDILFKHFTELILCHRFGRYEAYKNVKKFSDDAFDFAIRDAVFKYLAFFKVLTQLKLSNYMEDNNLTETEEIIGIEETTSISDYQQRIEKFFEKMNYKDYQKALFYLGRMLNSVAYIQKDKKKTVLDKLNFNGMEKNDIQRLRNSLVEKAEQYKEVGKIIFTDARFHEFFHYNDWNINPQEALFFILNGYSFGINVKNNKNL